MQLTLHAFLSVSLSPYAVDSVTFRLWLWDWKFRRYLPMLGRTADIKPQVPVASGTGSSTHGAWQALTPAPRWCLEGSGKCMEAFLAVLVPERVGEAALLEGNRDAKWQNTTTQ